MNESINDLDFFDDDDDVLGNGSFTQDTVIVDPDDDEELPDTIDEPPILEEENDTESDNDFQTLEEEDVITKLLKARGIDDTSKIKFENEETGELEDKNWKDLTIEEQFNILNSNEEPVLQSDDLDDSEIDLINRIRLSNMSVDDYLAYERLKGASDYASRLALAQEPSYLVDDYTDDELYLLDLQTKVGELTDDELSLALEMAKSNETLYTKQIEGLRKEYKELEEQKIANEQAIAAQAQQEQFELFSGAIANSIYNFNSIGDLDINMEDEDANELYNFITGTDPAGVNYLAKALNDPDTLTRVAWFALHGEDVINSISDYYKGVIAQVSKSLYEKGKQSVKPKKTPDVVINNNNNNNSKRTLSIFDLD